jgi:hypothetical protein
MLMGKGLLATIALQEPQNLMVVVFGNARYGETGMQHTHTIFAGDIERSRSSILLYKSTG